MSGWEVYDVGAVQVVPEQGSDEVLHDLDSDCICGPDVDFSGLRPLVTHHSLDGREANE
jgi:hypothetical protein